MEVNGFRAREAKSLHVFVGYILALTCAGLLFIDEKCTCTCSDETRLNHTRPDATGSIPKTPSLRDGQQMEGRSYTREILYPWREISMHCEADTLKASTFPLTRWIHLRITSC